MAVETYKCPNCNGGVIFDPVEQQFQCEYCLSRFTREEVERYEAAKATNPVDDTANHTVGYNCPNCGAEVVTDDTTAATQCYYCHNPVVISSRLDGDFKPDAVIPFQMKQSQAVEAFLAWVKQKRFVPRDFFSKTQIERIAGVYYPYWVLNCDVDASIEARAATVRVWRAGDTEYTETRHFQIIREGNIHFRELTKNALNKADHRLAEGVQPFEGKGIKDFTHAYLSGFQAEMRDINSHELQEQTDGELRDYAGAMLMDSVSGYTSVVPGDLSARIKNVEWRYVLLPVWVLTYRSNERSADGKTSKKLYYYAMNGQTGKVCGVLPVDWKRLLALLAGVSVPLLAALLIGGYFL